MRFHLAARQAAAEELAAWLERRDIGDGIRLVTGARGAGKSWLLARTALAADSEARELVAPAGGPLPQVGALDGVADASGETEAEWLRSLAAGMDLAAEVNADNDYFGFRWALGEADAPRGVVLSGAPGRLRVTSRRGTRVPELLIELTETSELSQSWSGYLAFVLAEVDRAVLAQLLRLRPHLADSVIDLDSERFAPDRAEFEGWVCDLLEAPDSTYAGGGGRASEVAAAISAAAWPNFLLAEVLAMEIRVRPESDAGEDLPDSLEGAWEFVLGALGPAGPRARQVLAPLVLAEGVLGMPDELRLSAATAVRGREVGIEELEDFESAVAAFVAEEFAEDAALQGGRPVRHARLRDAALADAAMVSYGSGVAEVQRRIASAVREYVPEDVAAVADGRPLSPGEVYALRFGIGHALGGGMLDEWLADVRVLALSDPQSLSEAVSAAGAADDATAHRRRGVVAEAVRAYRSDTRCGPAEWVSRLRFAAQMWGDHTLVGALDALGLPLPWRAKWVRWRPLGVFDTRAFGQGWTGPVEIVGRRSGADATEVDQVCLRSAYDARFRWYALDSGEQIGDALDEAPAVPDTAPTATGDGSVVTVEVFDDDLGLLRARVTRPGVPGEEVYPLCPPLPGAQAYPLPGGRVLLAGHSGAAVVDFTSAAGVEHSAWNTEAKLLPHHGWWAQSELDAADLHLYYQGGIAYADPARLGPLADRADVARMLCKVGLPGFPVFWQDTLGCLESLRTLEEYWAEQGEESEDTDAGYTVIAVSADEFTPLCVEHATGHVVQVEDGEPELVNTSVAAFAACQALTSWALSVSAGRQDDERGEFEAFVHEGLTRIDPEPAAEQGRGWCWLQAIQDASSYTLYG
ncbi:SUKH-4 family immunity protein [Kitasatospora sp. NPDC085879]|uniref:SUKH-4 family immunity protein n=1 Tax=Kitasatospora sp. NPDC085879 TaxID=3154769 RepID=UPI003437200C